MFLVDSATGATLTKPSVALEFEHQPYKVVSLHGGGVYIGSLVALDGAGQSALVFQWEFTVRNTKPFATAAAGWDATKEASASHLDLGRAPYGLYGVKYIDLVSLW